MVARLKFGVTETWRDRNETYRITDCSRDEESSSKHFKKHTRAFILVSADSNTQLNRWRWLPPVANGPIGGDDSVFVNTNAIVQMEHAESEKQANSLGAHIAES